MPGIVLFNRRWRVAADDFVFSSFAEIFLRTTWLIVFAVVVGSKADKTCPKSSELAAFYIGMMVILSLSIIVSAVTMYLSMQGTIANAHPRRHVAKVLAAKILLFIVELTFVAFGTYLAFGSDMTQCSDAAIGVVKVFVIVTWIVFGLVLVLVFILFDPLGSQKFENSELNSRGGKNSWNRRLKCLFCCCVNIRSDKTSDILEDIATLIADYLGGVDFVPSDVSAGLILVQEQQKQRNNRSTVASLPYVASQSSCVASSCEMEPARNPCHCPEDWMTIPLAYHFMRFSMGSYGWPLFVWKNLCTGGLCRLAAGCQCCSCIRASDGKEAAEGDSCCGCNVSVITRQTGISKEDVIYANFTNKIHEIPFYIAMDHDQKAVVVAVRGTMSIMDSITDLNAGLENMVVDGVPDAKAHTGILYAAHYIETTIRSRRLLETAFARKPGYRLVLTGHSLGAGAAAILAILLRPVFPQLICFAFSPPGWLLSSSLSRHVESYVCSIVVGDDIVPRLGFSTMEKLKDQMIKAIESCTRPKYQVLGKEIWNTMFGSRKQPSEQNGNAFSELQNNSRSDAEANTLEEANQSIDINCNNRDSRLQQKLFMPGRVLYLHEVKPKRGCRGVPVYRVYWRKPESFDEILLNGPKMLSDHFPDVVLRALFSASQDNA